MTAKTKKALLITFEEHMAYMDLIETQISLLLPQKGCSHNEANGPNRLQFLLKVVSAFEIHHHEHLLIANTIGNNLANFVVVLCTYSLFLGSYGNQADTVIHVYPTYVSVSLMIMCIPHIVPIVTKIINFALRRTNSSI